LYVLVYETPLTIDQLLTQLAEQPKAIGDLTKDLSRARSRRSPSRDEWSLNDVLAHLRSCGDMWGKYIATIAAEDRPDDPPDESHDLDQEHELPGAGLRDVVPRLSATACSIADAPAIVAEGRLVAHRTGDRRRNTTRAHGAGVRAVARQPRAIPPEADHAS